MNVTVCQFEGGSTIRALPLAAGLLVASARRDVGSAFDFAIHTRREEPERVVASFDSPAVLALSCYAWNERYSLEVGRLAKRRFPATRVVLGGPSVPRRSDAVRRLMQAHPCVDVLVHGEGEDAFREILMGLRTGADLSEVHGIAYRGPQGDPRMSAARARRSAFADLASPYLDGTFDQLLPPELVRSSWAVLETNRGCPFRCTFCDWGQAVHSPVRELPYERVSAELAWIAERSINHVYLVDANFGIRARDLNLARDVARLRRETGHPRSFFFHLTKNARARHLDSVQVLRGAGVSCQVALSMQDFDDAVLRAVRRSNIRVERALELRRVCNARGIPTMNELLLGLPEQTLQSFRRSVVAAITPFPGDTFMLYECRVLENAELADPEQRRRHGLETRHCLALMTGDAPVPEREEIVVATRTLSVDEWRQAYAFGHLLSAAYNLGPLRHVMRFLRQASGVDLEDWASAVFESGPTAFPGGVLAGMRRICERYARAILAGGSQTFPVRGAGLTRRPVDDALALAALAEPRRFLDEVRAATLAHRAAQPASWPAPEILEELFRFQALAVATLEARTPVDVCFEHDWLAWLDAVDEAKALPRRQTIVRYLPPSHVLTTRDLASFADAHLSASYAKALPVCVVRGSQRGAAPPPPWKAERNRWTSAG